MNTTGGAAYPDHGFADPHQLVVQLRVGHLHLLELENPLVAALSQLFFALLQTLDDLQRQKLVKLLFFTHRCEGTMLRTKQEATTKSSP